MLRRSIVIAALAGCCAVGQLPTTPVVAAATARAGPFVASPAEEIITTVAGGLGQGPATEITQHPSRLAVLGDRLIVLDTDPVVPPLDATGAPSVIRDLDLVSGIETVLGGSDWEAGFSGDGGHVSDALFDGINDLASDEAGNLYVADRLNHRVRRVAPDGTVTTVAGNGTDGDSGDGGPATSAAVSPRHLATGPGSVLYVATGTGIRRVDADGTISTVAGLPSGLMATDLDGNLYVSHGGKIVVRRTDGSTGTIAGTGTAGYTGDGGPAVAAQVAPTALTVSGHSPPTITITQYPHVVRRIAPTGTISTIAGTGSRGFAGDGGPWATATFDFGSSTMQVGTSALATDAVGNVYVSDHGNFRVRRLGADGTVSTVAGTGRRGWGAHGSSGDGGPATDAQLDRPVATAPLPGGGMVIADLGQRRLRKVSADGIISTVAGTGASVHAGDGGPATQASLSLPTEVATDLVGNIYVIDGRRVRRIDQDGIITTVAGSGSESPSGDGGPATAAGMIPTGIAVDRSGRLLISDMASQTVRVVDGSGRIERFAGTGFAGDGWYTGWSRLDIDLLNPGRLSFDGHGNLYVVDSMWDYSKKVHRISPLGGVHSLSLPYRSHDAAIDGAGRLYASIDVVGRITRVGLPCACRTDEPVAGTGRAGYSGDGGPALDAQIGHNPQLSTDGQTMYVSDASNHRVRAITLSAKGFTRAQSGAGLVLDAWGGVHPIRAGEVAPPTPVGVAYWPGWGIAQGIAMDVHGYGGGYVVDGWGGIHPFGWEGGRAPKPLAGGPYWPGWDIVRGLAVYDGGSFVLDGWGGLHPVSAAGARAFYGPYWPGRDIARDVAVLADGRGGYVLDGWGGLHPFSIGQIAPPPPVNGASYWPGWDIARGVTLLPDGTGGYVLDGWGGLHPFGIGNHAPPPPITEVPYWPGWDIARGIAIQH